MITLIHLIYFVITLLHEKNLRLNFFLTFFSARCLAQASCKGCPFRGIEWVRLMQHFKKKIKATPAHFNIKLASLMSSVYSVITKSIP